MRGDALAAGAAKAVFSAAPNKTPQDKWDDAVGSFDPKAFLKRAEEEEQAARDRQFQRLLEEEAEAERLEQEREERRRNANATSSGDVSISIGEAESDLRG